VPIGKMRGERKRLKKGERKARGVWADTNRGRRFKAVGGKLRQRGEGGNSFLKEPGIEPRRKIALRKLPGGSQPFFLGGCKQN